MKETFREKTLSLAIIYHQKQLKAKVWKTPWPCRPFFCEIEKQLLEENALLKPQGICPPLKSSVVFSVQNKNQRLPSADWAKKNLGNNF